MTKKSNNAVKAVSVMMVITLAGKVMGLLREVLLASNFGSGMEANAFLSASRIPRLFFDAVFASAISSSFIPIFNEYLEKKGKKEAFHFSDCFITVIGLVTVLLTVFGIAAAPYLTSFIVDGFDSQTMALCTKLLRYLFPTVIFTGVAYCFVGILQSFDEFTIPAAMSIVSNGVIIVYLLFFSDSFGVYGLCGAFILGWLMQAVMQVPSVLKKGYRYHFHFSLKNEGMRKVVALMLPVMVSTWIQPINITINTKFASRLFEKGAGVSFIEYANNLYTIIVGVFVLSIANVIFPELSRQTTNAENEKFGATIGQTIRVLSFLLLPMTVGLMALSEPIVRLIYERGEFAAFDTYQTSRVLFFLAIGMMGFGFQTILSRAYYAIQDGKTPLVGGILSIFANLLLCLALVDKFDVAGLAIASSAASILSGIVLLLPMEKRTKAILTKRLGIDLVKMILASVLMALVVLWLKNTLLSSFPDTLTGRIFVVLIPTGAGVLVYMAAAFFAGLEEAKLAFAFLGRILRKIKDRQ